MESAGRNGIELDCGGRRLRLALGALDKVPAAHWEDGTRPFQLFTRWYGFAYTCPGSVIWNGEEEW
jgi:hypothetical protein